MRWAMLLCLIATTFAGCSDGGTNTPSDDTFDDFGDVKVDDKTGIIRGLVIDAMVRPLEGVAVELVDAGVNTTTNEKGAFLFQDIEPGLYFLKLSKAGYEPVQANAEVKAGVESPPIVRVHMVTLPGSEPRYVPVEWQGHLGCSARYFIEGRSCPLAAEIWDEHDFYTDVQLDAVPTYITSDMVWTSTQEFGGEMSFNLRRTDSGADTTDIEGRSPLHLYLNETTIESHSGGSRGGFGPGDDDALRVIVFTAHLQETEPPVCLPGTPVTNGICPWGLGIQIDQPFNTYTHVFYNYQPPAEWRFTDDSTVPRPPE